MSGAFNFKCMSSPSRFERRSNVDEPVIEWLIPRYMALLFQKEISTTEMWDPTDTSCLLFSSALLQLPIWDSVLICDDVADWLNELQELGGTVGFLTALMFVPYQNTDDVVISSVSRITDLRTFRKLLKAIVKCFSSFYFLSKYVKEYCLRKF